MPLRPLAADPDTVRAQRAEPFVRRGSHRFRYILPFVTVALALLVRWPLFPFFGSSVPFLTFFPAVVAAAWFGGLGPGLLATSLSAVSSTYFLLRPLGSFGVASGPDVWALIIFVSINVLNSWIIGKLQEVSLREQTLRLASEQTLVCIGDGVIATDTQGNVTFINRVAQELTGWSSTDAVGRSISEVFQIVNETTGEAAESPLDKVLRERRVQGLANGTELISRNGARTPIDDSGARILSAEGDLVGAVLVFRDISDRRTQQRALTESRAQLQMTLDSIADAFVAMDSNWRFTYVNRAAEQLLGKSAQDLIGKDHWVEYKDVLGTIVEASYRAAVQEQRPIHFENYYGPLQRWLELNAYPTADSGLSVYFRDITEKKRAEALTRQTEAQLSLLAEANVIGIVFCDIHGMVRDANDEYLRIIGYTRSDLDRGRVRWTDVTPAEWLPLDQSKLAEAAERGTCAPYEKEYVRPDGTRVPVYVGFVLLGATRENAVAFVVDLSAQKQAEAALLESQSKLRHANAELQQFAYATSHDLKEPLRTITAYLQLLERQCWDTLDERSREVIRIVVKGAQRMQQLVDALLEYSRVGEVTNKSIAPVRLDHAVELALSALRIAINETAAIVTYDELPEVEVDALMLTQVFQNLIGNALKYQKPEQSPRVHITARLEPGFCLISVRDNGEGIAPEYHEKIFGAFQRLHGREVSGTGIGLATCRRIVDRWGGRIWVESALGQGSTFWFTIPAPLGMKGNSLAKG